MGNILPQVRNDNDFQVLREPLSDSKYGQESKVGHLIHSAVEDQRLVTTLGWNEAQPVEILYHVFSYLEVQDLARCAVVNRAWLAAAYAPHLWTFLDLSRIFYRVDNRLLASLISDPRFSQLKGLDVSNCTALTSDALKLICVHCPQLEKLWLNGCYPLKAPHIVETARVLPLRFLELYRVTLDYVLVDDLKTVDPNLDLGMFDKLYCASTGKDYKDAERGTAHCRHDSPFATTACWGEVKGRIVYSSNFYRHPGSYPVDVLYSCRSHAEADLGDEKYELCNVCSKLHKPDSMCLRHGVQVCRCCFDKIIFSTKRVWHSLNKRALTNFNFGQIIGKTVHLADTNNLPRTLKRRGRVRCELEYKQHFPQDIDSDVEDAVLAVADVPEAKAVVAAMSSEGKTTERKQRAPTTATSFLGLLDGKSSNEDTELDVLIEDSDSDADATGEEAQLLAEVRDIELNALENLRQQQQQEEEEKEDVIVPMATFLQANGHNINVQVQQFTGILNSLQKQGFQRSLLVYNNEDKAVIDVYADHRAIMDSRGAEHLALMNVAGRHVFGILAPIVTVMLAVVYFVSVNDRIQQSATSLGYNNYLAGVDGATKTASIDLEWYIIGAVLIVCMFGGGYMFSRRREQCIQVLRYVMLLDFWLMFVGGGAILVGFLAVDLGIPLDLFTLLIMVVNFGTMATFSMYVVQFPPSLHRVFLIALNIIMALLLAISLPWLMILVLVGLIAGLDMVSSYLYMHINGGELTPFILPTRFQLLYETPKLLYHVGGLRMRNLDLMLYGLMVSLMPHSLGAISVGFMVILCSIALVCFLNPYYGFDRLRPLPVALFFTLVAWYMTEDALLPCMSSLAPMLTRNPTTLTV